MRREYEVGPRRSNVLARGRTFRERLTDEEDIEAPTHTHHRKPPSGADNHFQRMEHDAEEGHPIDLVVEKRVQHRAARKRLIDLQNKILERLGDNKKPFFALEELRMHVSAEREEAYFDVGYEHGLADALATERRGRARLSAKAGQLATEFRERIVQSQVPTRDALLALLECVWAVAAKGESSEAR